MDIVEEVRSLERRIGDRLAELEPLLHEYNELRARAERLGLGAAAGAAQPPAPSRSPAGTAKRARKAARAGVRDGDRSAQVAALVAERPGLTVAGVAKELGVDATSLYRVVRRLEQRGQIRKDGTELHPVS